MNQVSHHWSRIPAVIRKPMTLVIGMAVIIDGLVMLVFPGPGWVAIFAGFAILATEFTIAEKIRDWLVIRLKQLVAIGLRELRQPWLKP